MIVPTYGVRYFGCTFEKNFGSRPSRDIEKKMRGWPSWNTISTLPIAMTAPSAMMKRENVSSPGGPSAPCNAVIIGSGVPSVCQGAMPVMTADSAMYSTVQIDRLMMMPNGMSFAGVLRLLGRGRHRVEPDVGEEDDRRGGADALESVRRETARGRVVPVLRVDQEDANRQEEQDDAHLEHHHRAGGVGRLLDPDDEDDGHGEDDSAAGRLMISGRPAKSRRA